MQLQYHFTSVIQTAVAVVGDQNHGIWPEALMNPKAIGVICLIQRKYRQLLSEKWHLWDLEVKQRNLL